MAVSNKLERLSVKALMIALNVGLGSTLALAQEEESAGEIMESQDDMATESASDEMVETSKMKKEAIKSVGPRDPKRKFYAAIGAGKTLPEGVMRVRLPFQNVSGEKGFDEDGNFESQGFGININAMALAVEYGLTDKISLAFVAPYITKNTAGMNAYNLRKNNRSFKREYDRYKDSVIEILQSQGLCSSIANCEALISNPNYSIPAGQSVTLSTGETVTALPNQPASRQIDRLVAQSVIPAEGATGLGDITLGGLYNFYDDDAISLSFGGGLRLPTGKFKDVPSGMRETGDGITDLGLRFNFDYRVAPWMVVALQHQLEYMVAPGKKMKASGKYNDVTNTGDPTTAAAIAIGSDGFDNDQKFEKWGIGHDGFLQLSLGLSDLADFLTPVGVGLQYHWLEGRENRYDGLAYDSLGYRYDEITRIRFAGFNISYDGLGLKPLLPFSLVYEYEQPVSGTFATVAPTISRFQLIGYYKF